MTIDRCQIGPAGFRSNAGNFSNAGRSCRPEPGIRSGPGPFLFLVLVFFALTPPCKAESLTIIEGLEIVISRGYDVRIAEAHRESASLTEDLAGSRMRPQVNAYADHTWLKNRPEAIFGGGSSPLSEDRFLRYGVTVRQTITDFGRTSAEVDSAGAAAAAQTELVDQVRNGLALDFVQAYIALLKAEKTLEVAKQEVKSFEAHTADALNLYDAGEVTRSDVLAAEVALSDALQREIIARDSRKLAVSRVNYLVLRPLDKPLQIGNFPFLFAETPGLDDLLFAAETDRPEIRVLDEQITARRAELRSQKNDGYPVLFVSGGYSFEENPYRVYEDNWSAVLGMTWDLYTGGARTASQARTDRELSAALTEREQFREKVHLEVREALLHLNGASERITVAEKALGQAEENLRLQNARYQEGEASATEVTDAVTTWTKAQNNLWDAFYDRQGAEAQVLFTSGTDILSTYKAAILDGQDAPSDISAREKNNE